MGEIEEIRKSISINKHMIENLDRRLEQLNLKLDDFANEFKGHKRLLNRMRADFLHHLNKIYGYIHGRKGRFKK